MPIPPPDDDPKRRSGGGFWGFLSGVKGSIVEFGAIVLNSEATAPKIIFFGVGVFALIFVAVLGYAAVVGNQNIAMVGLCLLAFDFLVAFVLMTWVMRDASPVAKLTAERDDARKKQHDAEEKLATRTRDYDQAASTLAAAYLERDAVVKKLDAEIAAHTATTATRAVLDRVNQIYQTGTDAIAVHYRMKPDRFPKFLVDETEITIDHDGTAITRQRRTVQASSKRKQHFLIDNFGGTSPLGTFLDLGFELEVESSEQRIAYLPSIPTVGQHDVLLAFLPPIETEPVTFVVSCRWPGAYRDLMVNKKKDWYSTLVRTAAPVPLVTLIFRIHDSVPLLKLTDKGTAPGKRLPVPIDLERPNYRTYLWQAEDVPNEGEVAVWLEWT